MRGRVERHALGYTASQVVAAGLSGLAAVVTARWLGPEGRGYLAVYTSAASIVAAVTLLGLHPALIALISEGNLVRGAAFRLALGASCLALVAGGAAGYVLTASWVSPLPSFAWATLLGLSAMAVHVGATQQAVASACARLPDAALNAVVTAVIMLLGFVAGWLGGTGGALAVIVAAGVHVVAQTSGDIVGWFRTLRAPGTGTTHVLSGAGPWGRLVRLAAAGYPHTVLSQLSARADILLLAWLAPAAAVGVYSLAAVASLLALLGSQSLGAALVSAWSGLSAERVVDGARVGLAVSFVATLGLGSGALILSWVLARWFLGPGFEAVPLCVAILLPGVILYSSTYVGYSIFVAHLGRPGLSSVATLVTVVVNLSLLVPLGSVYGAVGAALASSCGYACGGLASLVMLRRFAGVAVKTEDFGHVRRAALQALGNSGRRAARR